MAAPLRLEAAVAVQVYLLQLAQAVEAGVAVAVDPFLGGAAVGAAALVETYLEEVEAAEGAAEKL